jgi:hypothetical protein
MKNFKIIDLLLYTFAMSYVVYLLAVHSLTVVGFLFGLQPTKYIFFGAMAIVLIYLVFSFNYVIKKKSYIILSLAPFVMLCLSFLYGWFYNRQLYDISFDGQAYQGEAVVSIIEGWNPILQPLSTGINKFVDSLKFYSWLDAYPKIMWYNGAVIYDLTRDFKDIKFFNMSVIASCFAMCISTLKNIRFSVQREVNIFLNFLFSLLITFSPIAIVQSTTFSLDGVEYCFLVILFGVLYRIYKDFDRSDPAIQSLNFFNLISVLIVLSNLKTAGMVYGFFFSTIFCFFIALARFKQFKQVFTNLSIALVLAVGVFGFNPYITNIINYAHPLYPVYGPKAMSFQENTPSNFRDKSNVEIFVSSLFFKTSEVFVDGDGEPAEFKLPFTFSQDEIKSYTNPQLKKGAFGVLFGGIFILTMVCFVWSVIINYRDVLEHNHYHSGKQSPAAIKLLFAPLVVFLVLLFSFILTKTSSTHRYIPHLWLFVALILVYCFHTRYTLIRVFASFIIFLCFVNALFMSIIYFSNQIKVSEYANKVFNDFLTSGDSYSVYYLQTPSVRQLFYDKKIPVSNQVVASEECEGQTPPFLELSFSGTQICLIKK